VSEYVYPTTDYDRPTNLLRLLGTFWADYYRGNDQVESVCAAKGQIENQTITDLLEVANSYAYDTCPIFHTDNWFVFRMLKSEMNSSKVTLPLHDGSTSYNEGGLYDVPPDQLSFVFPIDENLTGVRQALNRFTEPSLVWTTGVDFVLEEGRITFMVNPFEDNRIASRLVYQDGEVVDEEAVLWLFKGEFDYETLYRQYGYVLNMKYQSSKAYRDMLTGFFQALVGGTTARNVLMGVSAVTGVPLVMEPTEVVEHVTIDGAGRLVITDQHSYRFPESATPVVDVGDTVHAGDTLADSLTVIELNRGVVPDDLLALAMGKGFLSTCYYSDLIFENKEVPFEVDEDHASGFTYVKFGLGGFPLDVERFFDDMHERGIAYSQLPVDECDPGDTVLIPGDECDGEGTPDQVLRRGTLAHLLDVRENPIGEPTAASLPDTINPLEFLIDNVLRANAVLVRVRAVSLGTENLGLYASTQFTKIVPPHTAMILVIELTPPTDSITVDMLDEDLETFKGMSLADDIEDMVDESFSISIVSGTCQ
jgi:hypothetical protein